MISPDQAATDYLSSLNDAQRDAATYGIGREPACGPLLVIAGAGSGKTNTLAHRVAHLLAEGADPDRILLLTFSRRAADEMTRRVQRIASQVSPRHARLVSGGFAWSGTFHSVGARLLADGDTITVLRDHEQVKIRLVGIDAPEKKQAFGNLAKQRMGDMVFGKEVLIDDRKKDR